MKTPLIGGGSDPLNNAATEYAALSGGFVWYAAETNIVEVIPTPGRISTLKVRLSAAPTGNPYTFTLMVNGNPSTLTCTVAVGSTTAEDVTHSVAVAAGDRVTLRSSYGAAPTNTPYASWYCIFQGTDVTESIIMSLYRRGTDPAYYGAIQMGDPSIWNTADAFYCQSRMPIGGTLKKLYCTNTVNDADTLGFTLYKNGGATTLYATWIANACTPDLAHSIAVADDDYLQMKIEEVTGDIGSGYGTFSMVFVPTTPGQFVWFFASSDDPANGEYNGVMSNLYASAWSAGEYVHWGLVPALTLKRIRVCLSTAPGAGVTRTFAVRESGVGSTALTVDIAGAVEVDDAASVDVAMTDYDAIVIVHTVDGAPAATGVQTGIAAYLDAGAKPPKGSSTSKLVQAGMI